MMWQPVVGKLSDHAPHSDVSREPSSTDAVAWIQSTVVAHALGDIDGVDYTNSREALEESVADGYTCVEFDVMQTSDGQWILRHDNQQIAPYHQLTLHEFLVYLAEHPQLTAIMDSKTRSQNDMDTVLAELLSEVSVIDPHLRDRLVIQTYSFEQYLKVSGQGLFPNVLLTLYGTSYSEEEVVAFAEAANVRVITMPWPKANPRYVQQLNTAGVSVYVHTVNSPSIYARMLAMGVHGIYTDVLKPLPKDPWIDGR